MIIAPLLIATSLLTVPILGDNYEIGTPYDLKLFSESVSNGRDFAGTTVLLTSDLDLSSYPNFRPIGQDASNYFTGDFDGQGHVLRNLHISPTTQYAALFGYTRGTTITNLVIDVTCDVTTPEGGGSGSAYEVYYASVLGVCEPSSRSCSLQNIVNMGSVTFTGTAQRHLWVSGLAGVFFPASDASLTFVIRDCVNYGTVTNSGKAYVNKYISGIVGEFYGGSISNCANYGTLTNTDDASTEKLLVGGIVAASRDALIENCLSIGLIESPDSDKIGAVVGGTWNTYTKIEHSYWTTDVGHNNAYGRNETELTVFIEDSQLLRSLESSNLLELNNYASKNNWGKWWTLHIGENQAKICDVQEAKIFVIQKHIPDAEREGSLFAGWYVDEKFKERYDPTSDDVVDDVYAKFDDVTYTITFDLGNETVTEEYYLFNSEIEFPQVGLRKGFRFAGWNMTGTTMPAKNVTVAALWTESTEFVEMVFSSVTVTKNDIKNLVKKFCGGSSSVADIKVFNKNDEAGETRVVLQFDERDTAESFVNGVEYSGEAVENLKTIDYFVELDSDFAAERGLLFGLLLYFVF